MKNSQELSRTPPIGSIVEGPGDAGLGLCAHYAAGGVSTNNETDFATSAIPTRLASSTSLPVVVRSQGHFLQLRDGRQVLDACGGAGVTCIGHGNLEILSAMSTEASNLTYIPWAFFDNQSTIDLQDWLIQSTGRKMTKVYLQSSGT